MYWTQPAQLPSEQGACLIQASASTNVVNSRQTRSGVQNRARPITACRPHGPPTASLAWATTGSAQDGTTRSGGGGSATRARSPGHRDTSGPSAGADGPEGVLLTCSVCADRASAAAAAGRRWPSRRCVGQAGHAAGRVGLGVPVGVPVLGRSGRDVDVGDVGNLGVVVAGAAEVVGAGRGEDVVGGAARRSAPARPHRCRPWMSALSGRFSFGVPSRTAFMNCCQIAPGRPDP